MTKQEYKDYEEAVAQYLNGIVLCSSGPLASCEECQKERDQTQEEMEALRHLEEEPWFSWRSCEICGDIAGGRVTWHGVLTPADISQDGELVHGSCCENCAYYMEYGRLSDKEMDEVEE